MTTMEQTPAATATATDTRSAWSGRPIDPLINALPPIVQPQMPFEDRLKQIFAHEKEYRGIDWLGLYDQGPSGRAQAARLAHAHLQDFARQHNILDEQIPNEIRALMNSIAARAGVESAATANDTDVMPIWPIDDSFLQQWENAQGSDIKNMIATQISAMQSIQTVQNQPSLIAQISVGIGVTAWVVAAFRVFMAVRALAGATEVYAVFMGVLEVGGAVVTLAVNTIFLAILLPILLIMLKDATVYMVVINKSPDDLNVEGDVDLTHGNLNIQFVDYTQNRRIPGMSVIKDPSGKVVAGNYWAGFLVAQKKEAALFGSQGAFKFAATPSFPHGVFVGWEIPLTTFGGSNRCLVALDFTGSTGDFSNATNDNGSGETTSSGPNNAWARQRMNSGGGSQGYMSVIVAGPTSGFFMDGVRPRDTTTGRIYLVLDGALRWVPNVATYVNLFENWTSVTPVPSASAYKIGAPITDGAYLAGGSPDGRIFFVVDGTKRWITSPAVFSRFGFNAGAIRSLTPAQLAAIPDGADIN